MLFSKLISAHTRRFLCRVSGLVLLSLFTNPYGLSEEWGDDCGDLSLLASFRGAQIANGGGAAMNSGVVGGGAVNGIETSVGAPMAPGSDAAPTDAAADEIGVADGKAPVGANDAGREAVGMVVGMARTRRDSGWREEAISEATTARPGNGPEVGARAKNGGFKIMHK